MRPRYFIWGWLRVFRRADASRMRPGGGQQLHTSAVRSEQCVRLRGRTWARERVPRPKARGLTETEKQDILRTLEQGIAASPVLSAFGVQARVQRGRFYIERYESDQDSEQCTIVLGRITPLTSAKNDLLLETERREGSWF